MALAALSRDEQGIVFTQLCNVLDPRIALALSSASNELRTATQALQLQLRAESTQSRLQSTQSAIPRQTHLVAWNTGSMHASQPATAKNPKRPRMRSRRNGHLDRYDANRL